MRELSFNAEYIKNGIINFSEGEMKLAGDLQTLTSQVKNSASSPLVSTLIWGAPGTGKTAMAAHIAHESGFPFVKIVSPDSYIGYHETAKLISIAKVFDDAYKSPFSIGRLVRLLTCSWASSQKRQWWRPFTLYTVSMRRSHVAVILDDIERLLDFTSIGPRFSNNLLQSLMVLVKKMPPKEGRRLLVIGTTSQPSFLAESGLSAAFQLVYKMPSINSADALKKTLQYRIDNYKDLTPKNAASVNVHIHTISIGHCTLPR